MINSIISGFIALAIFVAMAAIALYAISTNTPVKDKIPPEFSNWGGVIIGFYFGLALTQTASLIAAERGKKQNESAPGGAAAGGKT